MNTRVVVYKIFRRLNHLLSLFWLPGGELLYMCAIGNFTVPVQHGSNKRFVARELQTRESNEELVPVPEVVCKLVWSLRNIWYGVEVDRTRKVQALAGKHFGVIILPYSVCPGPLKPGVVCLGRWGGWWGGGLCKNWESSENCGRYVTTNSTIWLSLRRPRANKPKWQRKHPRVASMVKF